jgi:hypothetical protein
VGGLVRALGGGGGGDTTSITTAWCKMATMFGRAVGCLCAISTTFKTSPLCSTRASLLYVLLCCNIPRVMRVLGCIDPTLPSRRSPQTAPRLALPRRHRCEQKPCRCGLQKKESSACVAEGRKSETCHSVVCVHKGATLSFFACNECVNRTPPLVQEHSSQQEAL